MMEQFLDSSLLEEILSLVCRSTCSSHAHIISPGFEFIKTPDGSIVCAFSIREGDTIMGGDIIEVKDEVKDKVKDKELLAKLRSVKGQFVYGGLPVFYYDLVSDGQPYKFNPFAQ